jgi:hypothetical protein
MASALPHLVLEDAAALFVGDAGVDHQRQAGRARRGDVGAKATLLSFVLIGAIEIVEPGLAERHDLRMLGQLDEFFRRDAVFLVDMPGVRADRAIHIGKTLGDP